MLDKYIAGQDGNSFRRYVQYFLKSVVLNFHQQDDLVMMLSKSALHFLLNSLVGEGSLKIPQPLVFLEVEQPKIVQLAPGILLEKRFF